MRKSCKGRVILLLLVCECILNNLRDKEDTLRKFFTQIASIMQEKLTRMTSASTVARRALERERSLTGAGKPIRDAPACSSIVSEADAEMICQQLTDMTFDEEELLEDMIDYFARKQTAVEIPSGTMVPAQDTHPLWWVTKASVIDDEIGVHERGSSELAAQLRDDLGLSAVWTGLRMFELRFERGLMTRTLCSPTVFDCAFGNLLFRPCYTPGNGGFGLSICSRTLLPRHPEAVIVKDTKFNKGSSINYIGELIRDKPPVDCTTLEEVLYKHLSHLREICKGGDTS